MSRLLVAAFTLFFFEVAVATDNEPCTINRTGETGECIFFIQCPLLLEEYRKDRTAIPTVCNKERRRICCPLKLEKVPDKPKAASNFIDAGFSGTEIQDADNERFNSPQFIKKCSSYRSILVRNETEVSFVLGEPSHVKRINICNQNTADNGIAGELEFPHIAIIKLRNRLSNIRLGESKCIGSLISEFHVITSVNCVHSDIDNFVTVQLGSSIQEETENLEVEEIEVKYGIAILKLKEKVKFSERAMPICLYPDEKVTSQSALLTGWTGDWRDCEPKLKKWNVRNDLIEGNLWQYKFNETAILNYRETLMPGAPLQIYHLRNACQYSLVGLFEQLTHGQYFFNKIFKKLRWIENVAWPRNLNQMSAKTYRIMKKSLNH